MKKKVNYLKYIMGILVILFILMFINTKVSAVENASTVIDNENQENTVTVTLKISKVEKGLDALSGKIEYEKDKLEFSKIETGDSKWNNPSYNDESGKFTLLINSTTITEDTDAIKITFNVKEGAEGSTVVKFMDLEGATANDEKITFDPISTTINLKNEDGETDENPGEDDNVNDIIIDYTNDISDGNNEENDNNHGSNIENNSDDKDMIYNDEKAPGRLPQTGDNSDIIMGAILILVVITFITIIIIKRKNK